MDVTIKGVTFKDVDKVAESTYSADYGRGETMHTVVYADFDTGALHVHEFLNWDSWLDCNDPHVCSVGCGRLTAAQLVENIDDTFCYLRKSEEEREQEVAWYMAHPDEI